LGLDTACVAGLSFGGILALAPQRRHAAMSSASILASAYAGWAGSLPPEVAEQRLRQALTLAKGAPKAFVDALLPTMFSKTMPRETVDDFRASMQAFHPRGFRAMARAFAEDARDVLPHVDVPTLLVYGARDVRAPPTVAEALQKAISVSTLVVLPDAGHLCNIEAPNEFNEGVRYFLHDSPGAALATAWRRADVRPRAALPLLVNASVSKVGAEMPAQDEHQAPASPRSAPASLLHPWKSSGDAITAHFHASGRFRRG
jgi:esterase/lipase